MVYWKKLEKYKNLKKAIHRRDNPLDISDDLQQNLNDRNSNPQTPDQEQEAA